nr:MAG TPA: hypothetical protein [Caudoviricetes sp.]
MQPCVYGGIVRQRRRGVSDILRPLRGDRPFH